MLEDGDYDIEALIMDDATMGFAEGEAYGFYLVMAYYNHAV